MPIPSFQEFFRHFWQDGCTCVCVEELGERRRARGINKRLRVVWKQEELACAVCLKPRASKRLQFKPALRFLGLFAVDLLIRKHPWWPKVRYYEYTRETRANVRSFSRQLTLETELVVSSAMMVFWMALFARGRVIFVPGAPAICWVESSETRGVAFEKRAGDLEGNTSRVSKKTVRTTLFLFSVFIFCRHSSCRNDQFTVLFLKFGVEDFIDPGLLKIRRILTGLSFWFCLHKRFCIQTLYFLFRDHGVLRASWKFAVDLLTASTNVWGRGRESERSDRAVELSKKKEKRNTSVDILKI